MTTYSLYKTRKRLSPYPEFVKAISRDGYTWLVVEGVLTLQELERCDLLYLGHGMTYETCLSEIDRLEKGAGHRNN